ncbi:MAG: ShlB/FhaC/HecB family hemolysin secretion/activation protein [Alphaproteobacteria bacterium]|nr:ShlB/FhaC/HecB family hemolysin secretion/activation protein [Alphaproteobacteria bacterium]
MVNDFFAHLPATFPYPNFACPLMLPPTPPNPLGICAKPGWWLGGRAFGARLWMIGLLMGVGAYPALAQVPSIPGGADINRVQPRPEKPLPTLSPTKPSTIDSGMMTAPEGVDKIAFVLKAVKVDGVTVFPEEDVAKLYAAHIGQKVTLDLVWELANRLTDKYRNAGYFLSRAYIPEQKIADGTITLKVVEGYVESVEWEGERKQDVSQYRVVQELLEEVRAARPLSTEVIESYLLRLNDLPGLSFKALIKPNEGSDIYSGATVLVLTPTNKDGEGEGRINNNGSRFFGPNQASVTYQTSLIPLQQTSLTVLSSVPTEELRYGSLGQSIALSPRWMLGLRAGYTGTQPGAGLRDYDIRSTAKDWGTDLTYRLIRQRNENLDFTLGLDGKDTASDLYGHLSPLVRDKSRAMRVGVNYNTLDRWNGQHEGSLKLSQGLSILNGSKKGDRNLSRGQANPKASKAEISYKWQKLVDNHYLLSSRLGGQLASNPLLASEEFGYGGSQLGRAYDQSEMSGDHGLIGGLELKYRGLSPIYGISPDPYIFYDMGKLWNKDRDGQNPLAASSGLGVALSTDDGFTGNISLAFPMIRRVGDPLYGGPRDPRLLLEAVQKF